MGKSNKSIKSKMDGNLRDRYLLIGFLSIVLLHILGGFWHSYYSWGFSYWSVLPNNLTRLFGFIALSSLFLVYTFRNKVKLNFIDNFQTENKSQPIKLLFSISITLFVGFVLYFFRSKAHVYGDGYSILEFCSTDASIELIDQYRLQFLAVYWHQFMFKLLSPFSYFDKEKIFALTNVVGGLVGLWGVYKIAGLLARNARERLFFIVISLSSASIILFFGYIENYTWAMSIMMWSVYYCIRYMNNKSSIFPLLISSLVGFSFHMITLPVLATVLFVVLYKAEVMKKYLGDFNRTYLIGLVVAGSLLILFVSQLKGLDVFVPLWQLPKNDYSLFSLNHFSDIVNLLLLLAPLGLFFFLISLSRDKSSELKNDSTEKVLFVISFLTFLSACVIDPHLGMVRDFDLFSFYGIPLTLWAGYRFTRMYSENQFPNWVIVASSIVMLVHIVPNLYEKNHPQIAVEYLDTVLWEDPHYQGGYQDAYRGLSWAYTLKMVVNRNDLADKYYSRRLEADGSDPIVLYNLGLLYVKKNQLDSARYYLLKGAELFPREPKFLSKLSEVECKSFNMQLAENYAKESLKIDSNYTQGLSALAIVYSVQNKMGDAVVYFRKAYDLEPNKYKNILNLGSHYAKGINTDSALYYLSKAVPLAPQKQKIDILGGLISMALHLNYNTEAIEFLDKLKSIAPNSPMVKIKEKEIYGE